MNAYCINKKLFLFLFFVFITFASAYAHADDEIIIYVDVDKRKNIDFFEVETYGTSWNTAFRSLHDALRIGRTKKLEDSLEIYPNPVVKGSTLYINNPNALTLHTIEIHDLTGRLVKTVALEDRSTHITIDISSLANATYTVRIPNEHGNISKKIIINN